MPLNTPTTPSVTGVTFNSALITKGADGNPSGTFYAYQVTYSIGLNTYVMYLTGLGGFSPVPVYLNLTSVMAGSLLPNTLNSVALSAAADGLGTGATSFGPVFAFTTESTQPLFQPWSLIYSTQGTTNWLANFNPDGTQYFVNVSPDPSFVFGVMSSGWIINTSYAAVNLLPNTIYYAQVKSRNSVLAESPFTSLGSITTPNGPDTVRGLRSTNLLANRGFIIQWAANLEPNIALYRVYRSSSPTDNASFQVIGSTAPNVTSYVDNVPYSFGITWYYKVTALDTGNNESSLDLTNPVQDMSFSQFVEQPFPTQVMVDNIVNDEIPSGVIDGTNMLFTTSYPFKGNTLSVFLNGARLAIGLDFTLSIPQQFTLLAAPQPGDFLRVSYLRF